MAKEYMYEVGAFVGAFAGEGVQQAVGFSAFHAVDPLRDDWLLPEWKEETSIAGLCELASTYAGVGAANEGEGDGRVGYRVEFDADEAPPEGPYRCEGSDEEEGDDGEEGGEAPDHEVPGHADEGLPVVAGRRLWGLHVGDWLFVASYPLRLLLRVSETELALDFAGYCPKLEGSMWCLDPNKNAWETASSASEGDGGEEGEEEEEEGGGGSDALVEMARRGRGGAMPRTRAARGLRRAAGAFREAAVYRLRVPLDALHAASLWSHPGDAGDAGEAGSGPALLLLDLLRPPAFLARRPRSQDRTQRAFREVGDFTGGAAASRCPRLALLGDLAELAPACLRARVRPSSPLRLLPSLTGRQAASPAFRTAWARGADPAVDPAPGAYPRFLARREGLGAASLAAMSEEELRAALAAAAPDAAVPHLRSEAPREALLDLARALVAPAPAEAPPAPAPAPELEEQVVGEEEAGRLFAVAEAHRFMREKVAALHALGARIARPSPGPGPSAPLAPGTFPSDPDLSSLLSSLLASATAGLPPGEHPDSSSPAATAPGPVQPPRGLAGRKLFRFGAAGAPGRVKLRRPAR
eukprot:tig00020614_g12121.t1